MSYLRPDLPAIKMIQMELARILIRETEDTHVVELREKDGERIFPIVIGIHEAIAIERRLLDKIPPRPQTHELLENVLKEFGASVKNVSITELKNQTFYAQLEISNQDKDIKLDCRPSDALALGAIEGVPIFVDEKVLDNI